MWWTVQIHEKSSPRRSESIQIRPSSTKSMPDCRQKLPESIFRWFGDAFWSPKWSGNLCNSMKINGKLRSRLHIRIYGDFSWFLARQTTFKSILFKALCKTQVSWKSLFFLSKIIVFHVPGYQKSHQNRVQNTFEKTGRLKIEFEVDFGSIFFV